MGKKGVDVFGVAVYFFHFLSFPGKHAFVMIQGSIAMGHVLIKQIPFYILQIHANCGSESEEKLENDISARSRTIRNSLISVHVCLDDARRPTAVLQVVENNILGCQPTEKQHIILLQLMNIHSWSFSSCIGPTDHIRSKKLDQSQDHRHQALPVKKKHQRKSCH